jgi:hypothetical protein
MLKKLILALAISISVYAPTVSHAQQLIGTYVARLSEAGHFNSKGERLTSAAAIIRQDRANFHRYGIKDPEDEDDTFFADEGNRAALEQMLERGHADPGVISRIVNGTPLIHLSCGKWTVCPCHFIGPTASVGRSTDRKLCGAVERGGSFQFERATT